MPTLLYLHGYNSSSQSKKALQTKQWMALNAPQIKFICPDLLPYAKSTVDTLSSIIAVSYTHLTLPTKRIV